MRRRLPNDVLTIAGIVKFNVIQIRPTRPLSVDSGGISGHESTRSVPKMGLRATWR